MIDLSKRWSGGYELACLSDGGVEVCGRQPTLIGAQDPHTVRTGDLPTVDAEELS